MQKRQDVVTFKGAPLTLVGTPVSAGDPAPDFVALGAGLAPVRLSERAGRVRVLVAVPSLDTPVCDMEVRRFNQAAAELGPDVEILVISMDLPFAQGRWCGAAGVDRVTPLSDHREAACGHAYGILIDELRLLARAVFVIDREGRVQHAQIVPEITHEPDYDAALQAVKRLTGR